MKKILKIGGYVLAILLIIVGGLIGYVKVALPNVGDAPQLKVDATPERIERGRYLANNVTLCIVCHSERDWSRFAGPIVKLDSLGTGGERFDQKVGLPGVYYAKNITPAGISRYTDGELYRVITTGVTREGKAMFPLMPYTHYGKMDPEDIYSIIAYIRTLKPVNTSVPESESDFPMNIIVNTIPGKAIPGKRPAASDKVVYGAYMANACGCIECHTKESHGQIIPELAFSGGREFPLPDGSVVRSANITPDPQTGIGSWTEEMFINRFKAYADPNAFQQPIEKGAFNSVMAWRQYANMTTQDLAAIYTYLHSVKAMQNTVMKFSPAATVASK